eukprot:899631-Prorocentrum_lima.AAC.1
MDLLEGHEEKEEALVDPQRGQEGLDEGGTSEKGHQGCARHTAAKYPSTAPAVAAAPGGC